jgi:transposase InsO family protein
MRTTSRTALQQAAPDLVERNFVSEEPDRLWITDITCVRSGEGFLYLSFILDACSRKVVGWSMATHLRTELVVDALADGDSEEEALPRAGAPLCPSASGWRTKVSSRRWAGLARPTTMPLRRASSPP